MSSVISKIKKERPAPLDLDQGRLCRFYAINTAGEEPTMEETNDYLLCRDAGRRKSIPGVVRAYEPRRRHCNVRCSDRTDSRRSDRGVRVCSDVGASFDLAHGGVLGQSGTPNLAAYEPCEASVLREPKFMELTLKRGNAVFVPELRWPSDT